MFPLDPMFITPNMFLHFTRIERKTVKSSSFEEMKNWEGMWLSHLEYALENIENSCEFQTCSGDKGVMEHFKMGNITQVPVSLKLLNSSMCLD